LHLHVAFCLPPDRLSVVSGCAGPLWRKLVPSGSATVAEIYDLPNLAQYMTKELCLPSNDSVLIPI
jgi:hypothetical protein